MSVTLAKNAAQSGYTPCACRDCVDVTVPDDVRKPELCDECRRAGCVNADVNMDGYQYDCQRDDAYEDADRPCGCGGAGTHGVDHDDHDDYEDETPVNPQCSCRDCMDVSTTAAKGGWTLCRECLDAACTPYPKGTGPWPGRRPAGEYGCRRTDAGER